MALWTFMTLVGNGKRVYVEQVKAGDFRSALRAWHRTVVIDGMTDEARQRMASYEPREDAVTEVAVHSELDGVMHNGIGAYQDIHRWLSIGLPHHCPPSAIPTAQDTSRTS